MGKSDKNGCRPEDLCLSCGLCCNGVIFADVKLLPSEDPARLRSLGLELAEARRASIASGAGSSAAPRWKFPQPCAAFEGCRCRIYDSRPRYCRDFNCLLLQAVREGKTTELQARRLIRMALRRVEVVRKLLRALGNHDEATALAERMHHTTRRLRRAVPDAKTAEVYGRLTLAFHRLGVLLNKSFYPGPHVG